jgi:hypothetical protein
MSTSLFPLTVHDARQATAWRRDSPLSGRLPVSGIRTAKPWHLVFSGRKIKSREGAKKMRKEQSDDIA